MSTGSTQTSIAGFKRKCESTNKEEQSHLATGPKRGRDHGLFDSTSEAMLTDMEIMEKAKQIIKRVTDNLDPEIMMHIKDIIRHNDKIKQMNEVSRRKATIGIFGKSGEGKSSLLSAVLGKKDLLPYGCFGACTAVVTQVEANLNDSNYTAEIELYSKEEWDKELQDLFQILSDKSDDRNDEMVKIALEKMTALYGKNAKTKTLEELTNNTKIKDVLSNSKKTISKSDVNQFAPEVASYIQHCELSSGDWYWPLVKSVTLKVPDCHELLEHIVLVDIPGTGDCNRSRDDKWKSKMKECSFVWIVSDINRAITDEDPWGILKHCIEELGPDGECKKINFICTKSDDINPVAYIRSARLAGCKSLRERDQKKACILQRNKHAKKRVKEKFEYSEIQKKLRGDNDFLTIFTASSSAFFDKNLNLELSETEIPKLQEALKNLNKSINRELVRDYINEAKGVLSLIQSVQLDKVKAIKYSIIKEFVEKFHSALKEFESNFDLIYKVLELCLSEGVRQSERFCVSDTMAIIKPIKDKRSFHKNLKALCMKRGSFCSKNMDQVLDLNKQLAKHLQESIDFSLHFHVSGKVTGVQELIENFRILQSESSYSRYPMFNHIQNFIEAEENKFKASLIKDIVEKKKNISSSIQTTIQEKMDPCYKLAAAKEGHGSMKRIQDLIITTLEQNKLDMFKEVKMEVLEKYKQLKLWIRNTLETKLMESMTLALRKANNINIKILDVSREIEELDKLSEQLSD